MGILYYSKFTIKHHVLFSILHRVKHPEFDANLLTIPKEQEWQSHLLIVRKNVPKLTAQRNLKQEMIYQSL